MKTGTIMRIGAAGFVVTAIALSALQLNQPAKPQTETITVPEDEVDPLRAELRRCRSIGQAAASDTHCLRAWAEQRSRFFVQDEKTHDEWRDDAGNPIPADNAISSEPPAPALNGGK